MRNADLGERIQEIIREKGHTKMYIAHKCDYKPNQLSDILHGRKIVRPDDVARLCNALDVDPNTLFGYDAEQKPAQRAQ